MTGKEAAAKWEHARRRIRERSAHLTPKVLTNYPFEVLVALISVLMGLPFLLGTAAPASLVALVGVVIFYVWAAMLTLGGITVAVGLRVGDRPSAPVVAAGLQLAGGSFGVYALAVLAVLGPAGWTGFSAYALLCLLSFIRATHFRRVVDIQKGAKKLAGGGG